MTTTADAPMWHRDENPLESRFLTDNGGDAQWLCREDVQEQLVAELRQIISRSLIHVDKDRLVRLALDIQVCF